MKRLLKEIKSLEKSEVNQTIEKRLREFRAFENHPEEKWFQELCFCILAANSKQKTAQYIEQSLGHKKLLKMPQNELAIYIRNSKHRFHNNKAKYIVEARKYKSIKSILNTQENKRDFLVKNIKGLGMKEASHFLRNTGTQNLAILDRHIINILQEQKIIKPIKSLTPKLYIEIESKLTKIAKQLNMSHAKLDLMMWYLKTKEVAK